MCSTTLPLGFEGSSCDGSHVMAWGAMEIRYSQTRTRIRGWITGSWLALFGFGLFGPSACSSDEPARGGLAAGCTLDSDCNGNLVCTFGRCHTACKTSKDCAGGGRCVDLEAGNVCLLTEETPCSGEKRCTEPLVCASDQQCRKACSGSSACISDQVCAVGGICAETTEVGADGTLRNAPDAGNGSGGAGGTTSSGGAGGTTGSGGAGGITSSGGAPASGGTGAGGGAGGRAGNDSGAGGRSTGGGSSGGSAGGAQDGGGGLDGGDAGGGLACDVFAQKGCASGQRCTWAEDPANPSADGKLACVPNGTVGLDGACMPASGSTTGYDNCGKGLACINGTCKSICDPAAVNGLTACDATHACAAYLGIFERSDGSSFAGVCEPACNPLTQRRLTDNAAGCGGASRGCYGMPPKSPWPTSFLCSPAGPVSNTSDVVCAPSNSCAAPGGSPFINGCAPGFLPLVHESQGSSSFICAAVCEPGDTSASAPANAAGKVGSAYTCPAKGAGGSHECRFLWWFEGPLAPLGPNGNAFGICYDYTKYQFDSNDDEIPDKPQPSCTALSTTAHTYSPTITDTQYWGCEAVTTRPM